MIRSIMLRVYATTVIEDLAGIRSHGLALTRSYMPMASAKDATQENIRRYFTNLNTNLTPIN